MKKNLQQLLDSFNLPKHVAMHIMGPSHNEKHHLIASIVTIFTGSFLFNIHLLVHLNILVSIIVHTVAAYLHAVGLIPAVDIAAKLKEEKQTQTINNEPNNIENP
jgi:hypoxanthine-guanine phosphoribosyltransferase